MSKLTYDKLTRMYGAIDIGGTKTLIASFDQEGNLIQKIRFESPQNYGDFIKELTAQSKNIDCSKFTVIGLGVPAKFDANNEIAIAFTNLGWGSVPIKKDVEAIFNVPVLVENDAKLAALSEALELNNQYRKVLYLTVSTGIGAGLIIDNKIDPDFDDIEVGHMLFEHDGEMQRWEKFASGKAIVARFGKRASDIEDPETWKIISKNLAIGVINLIASLTPDAIVFGGGVGSHFEKFGDMLKADLEEYKDALLTVPPLFKAKRAEEAVIYGGYDLGKASHEHTDHK